MSGFHEDDRIRRKNKQFNKIEKTHDESIAIKLDKNISVLTILTLFVDAGYEISMYEDENERFFKVKKE